MRRPVLRTSRGLALVLCLGVVSGPPLIPALSPATWDGLVPAAWAQEEVDEEAQKRELERIRREAAEKRRRAQELKARESKVLKELRSTESRLRNTRKNIGQLTRREQELERQLGVVRNELERSQNALRGQRGRLAERLRNLYKYGRARELEFFLSAQSFAQLLTRFDFLARVAREDRRILLGITEEKEHIEWNQRRLDRTYEDVDNTLNKKQKEQNRLNLLAQQKKQSVTKIQGERQDYEAAAAELEQTARRIQQLLADLERRRREEEERRRGGQTPAPPPPYEGDFERARGHLDWPLNGELVGRFGSEKHPRFGTVTMNNGIDIRASQGEAIRSVARGRVDFTSDDYGSYGQMVILNHGSGYYTLYAHCSDILVSRGQDVSAGQSIARAGDSGSLKGTILHFEVRKGRSAMNPLEWLR